MKPTKHIRIRKHRSLKRHICAACAKPTHTFYTRTTPNTAKDYCEPCAMERGMLQ